MTNEREQGIKRLWKPAELAMRRAGRRHDREEGVGGQEDLLSWSRRLLPKHFARPASRMHVWLNAQLRDMHERRGTKLNVIGPRGSAKSTLASLAYLLYVALEEHEPYIWLVSDTRAQAWLHLDNLKAELTTNDPLRREYPEGTGVGPVWRAGEIQLPNGVRIEALSTGMKLRGRRRGAVRPTLIVCDDLQNDGHIGSALQRERSTAWFQGALLPAGNKRTNIIHVATALHREALAWQLTTNPGWTSRIFRAIERWPENMSLWQEWEALYREVNDARAAQTAEAFFVGNQAAMERGAELLWPEEEDLYTLMRLRAETGRTAFEREKQSSPLNPETCEWPEEYFTEAPWFDEWPAVQFRVVALDPSKGTDARRGDYSAFVRLGISEDGRYYVEADLARRPTPQIVADGVAHCLAFRADILGIESNQYQELLAAEFDAELRRQNIYHLTPFTLNNRVNKQVRIRTLGPLLANQRLRFKANSPGTQLLFRQLQDFPQADHDDGPDALEMAVRLAREVFGRA